MESRKTLGGSSTFPEYPVWHGMLQRCLNPKSQGWPHYGGRGITVCQEWIESFQKFLEDMGRRPTEKHSLDRIDNNRLERSYAKDNCRWATMQMQLRNTRRSRIVTYDGLTLSVAEWAERTGLPSSLIYSRLDVGWPLRDVFTIPSDRSNRWKLRDLHRP